MAVRLTGKVRRIVLIRGERGGKPVEFDVTVTAQGLEFRLAGTRNRKVLTAPWWVVLQNVRDEKKGYRIWGLDQAVAHLEDPETALKKVG